MIYDDEKIPGEVHIILQYVVPGITKLGPGNKFYEAEVFIAGSKQSLGEVGTVVQQQSYELLRQVLEEAKKEAGLRLVPSLSPHPKA